MPVLSLSGKKERKRVGQHFIIKKFILWLKSIFGNNSHKNILKININLCFE